VTEATMAEDRIDVCLVNMPYSAIERPSLALGRLKSILTQAGISTHAHYANLHFAEKLGVYRYQLFEATRTEDMVGEWTFRSAAFPDFAPDDDAYLAQANNRVLLPRLREGLSPERVRTVLREMRAKATEFVEEVACDILSRKPRIVGCSSTFQQHLASLAVLRRIREMAPEVVTVMGGANCETIMGQTTHRSFPWVDFVVSGEADDLIAPLFHRILAEGPDLSAEQLAQGVFAPVHRVQGYPHDCASYDGAPRATASEAVLDALPAPDFDDYFATLRANSLRDCIDPGLPVESSRGCWWGQKKSCSFCGLNGSGIHYRSRSAAGVLEELDSLSRRYDCKRFEVVDNILDMGHFPTLIAALSERPYKLFYETKSSLRRRHVAALARAGVTWIQPGIENLSTPVLRLMNKGTQAHTNIQLLKWTREFGVRVAWNCLFGFPGEQDADYAAVAAWLPLVEHLQPPSGLVQIRIDRYSRYHRKPAEHGLRLRPAPLMRYVYPLSGQDLVDHCYFFEYENEVDYGRNASLGDPDSVAAAPKRPGLKALHDGIASWSASFWGALQPLLCQSPMEDGGIEILDTRRIATQRITRLDPLESAIIAVCDEAQPLDRLAEILTEAGHQPGKASLADAVERLTARGFVIALDDRLLALPVAGDLPSMPQNGDFPGGYIHLPPPPVDGVL
jgi:ribosomal peptide maturation radical SAM protein 1